MAIDRQAIQRTIMRNLSIPAAILVAPGVNGHSAELDKVAPPNIDGAKKLLAEAGVDSFIVSQYTGNLKADEAGFLEAQAALSPKVKRRIRYRTLGDEDPLSTSGGLVPVRHPVTKSKCMQASLNCVVDFRGDVVLCCNDYYGEHTFGNVGREHIVDIWNKPGFRKLRQRLRGGHFDLEICKACASGTLA